MRFYNAPVMGTFLFLLAVAVLLVVCAQLGQTYSSVIDLCFIIVLGLPHGALDTEIARPSMRRRFGRWWFPVFAVPYLGFATAMLVSWQVFPLTTLAAFLAMSAWHFGEVKDLTPCEILGRGGAPIALPVLFHPAATAQLLSGIAQTGLPACPAWLIAASHAWIFLAGISLYNAASTRDLPARALELAVFVALYAWLSPLTALAIYFVCLHSPAHMRELIAGRHALRVTSMRSAIGRALPVTALTVVIGAGLWPLYAGDAQTRLLALTIQGLAALTLPHMLMDATGSLWHRDRVRYGLDARG